jgi:CMP-N-acetylneuraminic acid synthetase
MVTILAIIPVRDPSKGISKKYFSLEVKPLIVHSVEDSLTCSQIQRALASTYDSEIAEMPLCIPAN